MSRLTELSSKVAETPVYQASAIQKKENKMRAKDADKGMMSLLRYSSTTSSVEVKHSSH